MKIQQVTTTWRDVLDQVTTGHEYLRRTLGDSVCARCVKYGWQIDMFAGYSGERSDCKSVLTRTFIDFPHCSHSPISTSMHISTFIYTIHFTILRTLRSRCYTHAVVIDGV